MIGVLSAVDVGVPVGRNGRQPIIAAEIDVDGGGDPPDLPLLMIVDIIVDIERARRCRVGNAAGPVGNGRAPERNTLRLQVVAGNIDVVVLAAEGELAAHGSAVALVVAGARGNVIDEAIAVVVNHREPRRRILTQRQVGDRGHAVGVVVAHFPGHQQFLFLRRLLGDHADGPCHRVFAEQCALWSTGHFHPLQVEDIDVLGGRLAHVHAIDIDSGTRVEADVARVCTDAADAHSGRAVVAAGDAHIGDEFGQLAHLSNPGFLQCLAAHYGNRDGHIGEALGALLRGHHDLLEHARVALGGGVDRQHEQRGKCQA